MSDSADVTHSDEFRKAKLAALAEFAAGAGHEINNPVATIVGRAELLLKGETNPERRQALLTIGAQALRIRDMIGDLMLFARPPQPTCQSLDLVAVVEEVVRKLDEVIRAKSLTVERRGRSAVAIWADPVQLRVVISNLLHNSVNASAAGGTIVVACESQSETGLPQSALLTVEDHGTGLSPEDREHLFDPFYSARQAGRGLGFGLAKCWRIVEQHGGRIEVTSEPNGVTRFRVFWPSERSREGDAS